MREGIASGAAYQALEPLPLAKILIVDDRQENVLALEAALKDSGHEIVPAFSGREALQKVRDHDFAVILLDVQMPIMDGFAAARLIRKEPRSRFTPIIFVTASHGSEFYEQRGYEAGAVDYLFKPLNIEILRAKISIFVELYRKNEEIKRQAYMIYARDEFLSIASHELKTPLTPLNLQMQAFLSLMENDTFQTLPREKLERMLRNSFSQVGRLTRLIDELLDVSRISSGRLSLHLEEVNIQSVLDDVIETFSEEIANSGCKVSVSGDRAVTGHWDRFRLEQIVINLLTNALKYGRGKPVEISFARHVGLVSLSVRDYGIGIAKEDQSRIFDRFERAVSARNFGGLGLGLYIVSEIVKLHHGAIQVESEPGAGARFTVELPA